MVSRALFATLGSRVREGWGWGIGKIGHFLVVSVVRVGSSCHRHTVCVTEEKDDIIVRLTYLHDNTVRACCWRLPSLPTEKGLLSILPTKKLLF